MKIFTRYLTLGVVTALILSGCNIGGTSTPPPNNAIIGPASGDVASVSLTVVAINGSAVFNTVGQVINYSYTVTNNSNPALQGPVTISDDKTTAPACAAVTSVGNLNNNLDNGESVICVSTYSITQNDLNSGSVSSNATARVGNTDSNRVNTIVRMATAGALTLTITPNPATYSAAGQAITFTYLVRNSGTTTLGPTQFSVSDNKIGTPINCDVPNKTLAPNDSLNCNASYTVTQNDMSIPNFVNTATASGGGVTSPPATSTVTKSTSTSGAFTRGANITHNVVSGEWLYQIARCYDADINAVIAANPQIADPHWILPAMTVSVPNIGVKGGTIYGPPCVGYYVAQVGDTWENIGTRFNADVSVLKAANKSVVSPSLGNCIKIALNSARGATTTQAAASSCPGGTTQPPPVTQVRITIPQGSTSVTLSGTVQASSRVQYLLAASQNQSLSVKVLNAPANELTMGIFASNGSTMKAQDATLTFSGTIPSTGDVRIEVVAVSGTSSKTFTLEVIVTAQPTPVLFERAADVNPGLNSSDPAYLAVFNGQLFFRATGNDNTGSELWKYDPASKLTNRVKDTNPGPTGSDPSFLTPYNGALYFRANGNDGAGVELWRWNGSDAGRLTDINPQAGDANPSYLAVFKEKLYFSAKGGNNAGTELWMTDGTSTTFVADINAGAGDSNPAYLTVFNNALYFSAVSTDGFGVELWKYDGVNAPTRVTDINPTIGNSNPSHLTFFNNALYFAANANDGFGIELWKYDGVNAPSRVADINPNAGDSAPGFLSVFNGALYFSATSNDGAGIELWKYDAVNAPKRVGDLNTAGNANPSYLLVFNNELYFQANGNDGAGTELWKFKGP